MTDLLQPDEVREMETATKQIDLGIALAQPGKFIAAAQIGRLCRDYLTLWEKVAVLEGAVDLLRKTCGFDKLHTESQTHD